jgi:hypothetical protein
MKSNAGRLSGLGSDGSNVPLNEGSCIVAVIPQICPFCLVFNEVNRYVDGSKQSV